MKRKLLAPLLCIVLIGALLAGCGGDDAPKTFSVTVENSTIYAFNELYVSATASDNWGSDHLGSTNILKANGSYDITLEKYDYENYDVLIVDEDGDEYLFRYVTLTEG
ncbi:hypothetical protein LJC04_05840, partial [Ruminococcaceae bacterium OttesenSCG-928-O06]|nr:hypothetical protein [Ruminococcaceae bacterium OttesenSCG-928-O06]